MKIPYVIDNQVYRLADILNALLAEHKGRSLDVATAYFTVGGFGQLKEGLLTLGNFRLLLGAEPTSGDHLGLRPESARVKGLLRRDLEAHPFDEHTLRLVEDLIAYLRRNQVAVRLYDLGFLHAKCYLFYNDRPEGGWDRFHPVAGIVGSSNFTVPGLTSNRELNLAHKTVLSQEEVLDDLKTPPWPAIEQVGESDPEYGQEERRRLKSSVGARAIADLDRWFYRQWREARDFKEELIELLDASKFGEKKYTPYQVYMKALYEYFKDDLAGEMPLPMRSAVELAEFQEDAVKKARKILSRYDGVLIADSVGLGKTWIGKKLLEDFAYHLRQKALVVCPASLREMWERELGEATVSATVLSQEELGREAFDPTPWGDADVVLIDESHNFRNRNAQRYANMEYLLGAHGGRGRDGSRKKVILLTATPINNDLFDLYNQLSLITRGDRSYFKASGIGDLHRYFLLARRDSRLNGGVFALFNLLEEIVIRRTRPFIRKAYPYAVLRKREPDGTSVEQPIRFPDRRLRTVNYNLEATEEEQFIELASNEFLVQQLRALLDAGGQEMLESLPDGIHSGLAKAGAKGVFFYFQARDLEGGKLHFWKYFDLNDQRMIDNRYIVGNLIGCHPDTPRVVDPEMFRSVFDLQEKVIEDILRSFEEQKALEVAPRSVDPIQQTLATVMQGYLNHPDIERRRAIECIRFLNQPMLAVQVRELREAYKNFQQRVDIESLLSTVEALSERFGRQGATTDSADSGPIGRLSRADLQLICFDLVTGG